MTNTANVTLGGSRSPSTDDRATVVTCPPTVTLRSGSESITCTATYTITQADLDGGYGHQPRRRRRDLDGTRVASDADTATVDADQVTGAARSTRPRPPATYDEVGDVLTYTYEVTNTGNVTMAAPVTVTDDRATVDLPADDAAARRDSITCTATYTITQADLDAGR